MITRHAVASHAPRTALGLALLAMAIVVIGCGGSGSTSSRSSARTQPGDPPSDQAALASGPVVPSSGPASSAPSPLTTQPKQAESLPPDIEVMAVDSLVTPGQGLLITVLGTPDVSELALSDGGDTQYFYKDPTSNTWRVQYRVPLGTDGKRVALSVTARNDDQRWRRRWVFLNVQESGAEPAAESVETEKGEGSAPQS